MTIPILGFPAGEDRRAAAVMVRSSLPGPLRRNWYSLYGDGSVVEVCVEHFWFADPWDCGEST